MFATKGADDVRGRLARRQWNDENSTAPRANLRCPDDGFLAVVPALHEDIRAQPFNQLEWGVLVEHHDAVHHLEGREDVCALGCSANRTRGALQAPDGVVSVDRDDQRVTLSARAEQDVDVSRVQEVEDAIGE